MTILTANNNNIKTKPDAFGQWLDDYLKNTDNGRLISSSGVEVTAAATRIARHAWNGAIDKTQTILDKKLLPTAEVPLKSFNSMNWVTEAWNLRAIIRSENNTERKLREAIMLQSEDAPVRNVFTHIGWRQVDDKQVYLSSNGGLGIDNAEVELDQQLGRYYIPQPSGEAKEAMKHSLDMIDVSRRREVTLPLWASMFLSPLADIIHPSFTLWYVGASGSFKSTLTSLALCHFGDFDSRHIPASWVDTDNALEKLMFLCKDAPLLIDDWAPGQDAGKARQLETRAERIVRAQGNRQGKGRLRSDTSARPSYIPRGMLITSGEQLPSGHSHTARLYTVELEREDIDINNLTTAQQNTPYYRQAMAHYLTWLSGKWDSIKKSIPDDFLALRGQVMNKGLHARLPEVIALLCLGLKYGLDFAVECGALTLEESNEVWEEGMSAFISQATDQGSRVEEERPAKRFIEILNSLKESGSAILGDRNDDCIRQVGPAQTLVGWNDQQNGHVLILGQTAYKAVKDHCRRTDEPYTIKYNAVIKDLRRMGYIDCPSQKIATHNVCIANGQKRVLKLRKVLLNERENNDENNAFSAPGPLML